MAKAICILAVLLGLATCQTATEEGIKPIELPNVKMLRCKSSDCFQLWPMEAKQQGGVYPKRVILDMNQDCLYGLTVLYDKSISIESLTEAIDAGYGRWKVKSFENVPLKLWHVESEKFSIQLSVADKKDERRHFADEGMKVVIFIAFSGKSACSAPPS